MTRQYFSMTIFLLWTICSIGQQFQTIDTLWFNNKWEKTDREHKYYYRIQKSDTAKKIYIVEDYYQTGEIQMTGTYASLTPQIRHGIFTWYYTNGKKQRECNYSNDSIYQISEWDINGIRKPDIIRTSSQIDGEEIFELKSIERAPEFPDGNQKLMEFISKNVKYPAEASKSGISGKVIVQFVVTKKGKVINATVVKSVDPSLDKEALRVVNLMPKWSPGIKDGKEVNVKVALPINFKL